MKFALRYVCIISTAWEWSVRVYFGGCVDTGTCVIGFRIGCVGTVISYLEGRRVRFLGNKTGRWISQGVRLRVRGSWMGKGSKLLKD